jgi:GTP-dependent phosphoenolpyruvate carboxykinase
MAEVSAGRASGVFSGTFSGAESPLLSKETGDVTGRASGVFSGTGADTSSEAAGAFSSATEQYGSSGLMASPFLMEAACSYQSHRIQARGEQEKIPVVMQQFQFRKKSKNSFLRHGSVENIEQPRCLFRPESMKPASSLRSE